jgi:pimeloyl-ACP methyl ester carboxylesterase
MRAALEYARMRFMRRDALPRGDDHPVVIFPGLATDERFTAPLARHCADLGYTAHDWGRGLNTGPEGDVDAWLDDLAQDVQRMAGKRATISLIGWSLGGIYAREIAKRLEDRVRQVITIGTPFAGTSEQTNARWLYVLLNGQAPVVDASLARRLRTPPPVPTSSIYSRSDGVVAWQSCRQTGDTHVENIEVESSHIGLVWHPEVLEIIADRLAQPEGDWQPWSERAVERRRAA